jgi:hypothetical protein
MKVVHLNFARAAAAAESHRAGLVRAPRERFELNLALVRVILTFAFNACDLQEIINRCHRNFSFREWEWKPVTVVSRFRILFRATKKAFQLTSFASCDKTVFLSKQRRMRFAGLVCRKLERALLAVSPICN